MKLKSNAPLLLSSLSFFHHILQCLLIAPCGAASLQSCHRIRSFMNPLVHFNYPIICLLILCVSRLFCVVQSILFSCLADLLFSCLADLLFYGNLASSIVSSQLASPVSRLVSSRLNSSHLVPSCRVSRLLSSHRLPGHITLPPTAHRFVSHIFSSRLSGRLVSEFTSQVSSLGPQVSDPKSPISCLMSQISSL